MFPWGICRRGVQPSSFSGVCELPRVQQVHLGHSSQLPILRDVSVVLCLQGVHAAVPGELTAQGTLTVCSCLSLR